MGISKGLSSLTILTKELKQEQREVCLNVLIQHNFKGFDYKVKNNVSLEDLIKKDPDSRSYSCEYKDADFVISCPVERAYIILKTLSDNEDSKIIIKVTDEFCMTMDESLTFSYIDNEGDSPDDLRNFVSNNELKWLFKYNYFGKDFIEKFGKDFFLNMPCEKVTKLKDDIIRVDLTKDIFKPIDKELAKKIYTYLEGFDVKVSFYNYKNFLID